MDEWHGFGFRQFRSPTQTTTSTPFGYTPSNRLASATDAINHVTSYAFDGNMTSMTDASGRETSYQFDEENCLITVTLAEGNTITNYCEGVAIESPQEFKRDHFEAYHRRLREEPGRRGGYCGANTVDVSPAT